MRSVLTNVRKIRRKELTIVIIIVFVFFALRFSYRRSVLPTLSIGPETPIPIEGYITVLGQSIYSKSYKPNGAGLELAKATVLLLHGAAFSSENWKEINTLQSLQSAEIFAFAIDLPGYGKSKNAKVTDEAEFIKAVLDTLEGDVKILVSPSMSGKFSIPFINRYGEEIAGFVPIAPVSVKTLSPSKEVSETLSVFAVAGGKDRGGVGNLSLFQKAFKHCEQWVIENAVHPAYIDEPELFNVRLKDFALSLNSIHKQ